MGKRLTSAVGVVAVVAVGLLGLPAAGAVDASTLPVPEFERELSLQALKNEQVPFTGEWVEDVAFDPTRGRAYVSAPDSGRVLVFDTTTWMIVGEITTGGAPMGLDVLHDGDALLAAIDGTGEIVEISLIDLAVTRRIDLREPLNSDGTYDVREVADHIVLATATSGPAHVALVDLRDIGSAASVADGRFIRGAPRIYAIRGSSSAIVSENHSPNSLYRLDLTDLTAPIVAENAHTALNGGASNASLHPGGDRLFLWPGPGSGLPGQEVATIDLTAQPRPSIDGFPTTTADGLRIHTYDPGIGLGNGVIRTLDATTLTQLSEHDGSCAGFAEIDWVHRVILDPAETMFVVLSNTGLCLEPLDGSGRPVVTVTVLPTSSIEGVEARAKIIVFDIDGIVGESTVTNVLASFRLRLGDYWFLAYDADGWVTFPSGLMTNGWPMFPAWHDGRPLLSREPPAPVTISEAGNVSIPLLPVYVDMLDADEVFWDSIFWLQGSGITQGCTLVLFCAQSPVTRGQMAAFFNRAFGLPDAGPTGLVDEAGVFAQDIRNIYAAGITFGCSATHFCTNDPVTRGEMAAFLNRALGLPDAGPTGLLDEAGVFAQDIRNIYAAGITQGCSLVLFCTGGHVTRQEMAAFMDRALAETWPFV